MDIFTLAERTDLVDAFWAMDSSWPEFMKQDPIGNLYYGLVESHFSEYVLVVLDDDSAVAAQAYSVPFPLDEGGELPDDGWRGAIRRGVRALHSGESCDAVSAIEIEVRPDLRGTGLSAVVLGALRDNARRLGHDALLAPVRPNGKQDPHEPMTEYAARTRPDGLPADPWLRVHVRAGGRIEKVARCSMVISGTVEEWRDWTGLPFDATGPVEVPGALAPVHCDAGQRAAVYVEPNVWIRHPTTPHAG